MSFQQGLSGLNASSRNLEVIGNNVANANTYGTKASRAEFADMYATALNGAGGSNIGIGVRLASVAQQFTQGNITATENGLDLAINGNGFFQVRATDGQLLYTRNGQFKIDRDGFIVNNQGQQLLGYQADGLGTIIPSAATPLQLPTAGIAPRITDEVTMEVNLDARASVTTPAAGTIDFADPRTYNNATSQTMYDAIGQDVAITYYFQNTGTDTWNVYATANGQTIATDGNGDPAPVQQLTFTDGVLTSPAGGIWTLPDIPADPAGRWQTIVGPEVTMSGTTQYGAAFGVTNLTQNGYAPGQLSGLSFEENGVVTARYSNGQTKSAGQIELATFRNPQGLQPLGGNAWARTFTSGDPIINTPGVGNLGKLQAGALEDSNVDLTGELVNMITAQRVYQANAQTIKTQDSVLQTLVNLR